MKKKAAAESSGEKVPLWIISFADMITLLLSFFVMLQTMAKTQDATLFGVSQESFRRSISGLGIPDLLFGKRQGPQYDYRKLKYPTEESTSENWERTRIIDAEDEQIRQAFNDLQKAAEVKTSDPREERISAHFTHVRFDDRAYELNSAARKELSTLAGELKQTLSGRPIKLYVVALAPDAPAGKEQWLLSARRARAVEQFLQGNLSAELQKDWQINSSGAAAGEDWQKKMGLSHKDLQVMLVVMGVNNGG